MFDKVVVITDRRVLDRQLQETIHQFEHVHGLVEKIDNGDGDVEDGGGVRQQPRRGNPADRRQQRRIDGADVCRVHVHASGFPVDAKVTVDKNGQMIKKTAFYVRAGNATRELDDTEKAKYILGRWGSSPSL
ncbi:MAG: hypothetical protein ACRDTC_28635 [Pseudonocardiaceae bacterium]